MQQFHFARQLLVDVFHALRRVVLFENGLALGVGQIGQSAGDEIGEAADFGDVGRCGRNFVRDIGRGGYELGKFAEDVLAQRGEFRRDGGFDLGEAFDAGAEKRLGRGVFEGPHTHHALAEEQLAFAHANHFVDDRHGSDPVQFVGRRLIGARIGLRDDADQAVLAERLDERDRGRAPDSERKQRVGEKYGVANGEDREFFTFVIALLFAASAADRVDGALGSFAVGWGLRFFGDRGNSLFS